ncbi:MAG: hypothetical protein ACOX6T_12480 [Myxococcales bacterium]|jgi:hypothetical protein
MSEDERLQAAILTAGVGVEQVGLDDGVRFEVDEDEGTITLTLGAEGEETFDDIDEALERIEAYGEEYGGDGSRPGAIVEFVSKVNGLVAKVPPDEKFDELMGLYDRVEALAEKIGLESWRKVSGAQGEEVMADEHGDVGFYQDGNGVLWYVFVDEDGCVGYRIWDGEKFDEDE